MLLFLILQVPLNSILFIYLNDERLEKYKKESYKISLAISSMIGICLYIYFEGFPHIITNLYTLLGNIFFILIYASTIILTQFLINKFIMNSSNKKSKWAAWVIGIQSILIVFFFLFAYVAKLEADKNMKLAQKNEEKAERTKKEAEVALKITKEQLVQAQKCCSLK